ncbi:MAG: type IV pilus secretin PilQ, partial [Gammaproteobacteria bacterium]
MKDFARFRYCTAAARLFALALAAVWSVTAVAATTLDQIEYSALPGDRVQVRLQLSESIQEPLSFAIDNPARVALDFPNVSLNLTERTQTIGIGMARSITAVEAGGRTRVVLNLIKLVPYTLRVQGNSVLLTVESAGVASAKALDPRVLSKPGAIAAGGGTLENVDFRRGEAGEGRVMVGLSSSSVIVDSHQEGNQIIVDFLGASLPERLARRLDVVDFATPVTMVDTFAQGDDVRMILETTGGFEHLAYQSDNLFTLDVKPLSKEEAEATKKQKFGYSGEKLSLNFQNIEVRAVLQLLADFTGLNLVASDTVSGSLTLRLKNVPWDQAMDIILKTKGLAMRQTGNVILVAPSEEIAAREKLELEANKQITELAPLQIEFVQINYAKAGDIAQLLKAEENSLMSDRGNVTIDDRTNTLLVRDTATNIANIRRVVATLDIPVRQVLIESRIVLADDDFSRDLGVEFGFSKRENTDNEDTRWTL